MGRAGVFGMTGSLRRFALGALGLLGALSATECRDPTELTLVLSTDAQCSDVTHGTSISVGKLGELEGRPESARATRCDDPDGRIGTLVVVPSGDKDDEVAIRVVTGVGSMSPESCVAAGFKGGCIVARRAVRYLPHTPLTLPIELSVDCIDIPCGETETCFQGQCVPAKIENPKDCAGSKGCEPKLGDGGTPDAPDDSSSGGSGGASGASGAGGTANTGGVAGFGGTTNTGGVAGSGGTTNTGGAAGSGGTAGAAGSDGGVTCSAGTGECDGNLAVLCETDLTSNPLHCGACGHDCAGGDCLQSVCQPKSLFTSSTANNADVTELAMDATHVYFLETVSNKGAVNRLDKTTLQVETIASSQQYPRTLTIDGSYVYWGNADSGEIRRAAKGSNVHELLTTVTSVQGITVDASKLYATSGTNNVPLYSADKSTPGGAATPLAVPNQDWAYLISMANGTLFWNVYLANGALRSFDGSTVKDVATSLHNPRGFIVDGTQIFYLEQGTNGKGALYRSNTDGTNPATLASNQGGPVGIALDASFVYWTNNTAGTIMRTVRGASAPGFESQVATYPAPRQLVVDGSVIYFSAGKELLRVKMPLGIK